MAYSTIGVELWWGSTFAYKKVNIKSFPDLGGTPSFIDITTLSNSKRVGIAGIKSGNVLDFTANYEQGVMSDLVAAGGVENVYELMMPDGSYFTWTGYHSLSTSSAGVGDVIDMVIHIVPNSEIERGSA